MYYVYILKSLSAPKTYVGLTDNLERRLRQHNAAQHFYTKRHLPWQMIFEEKCASLKKARQREKYLKSAAGRRFMKTLFAE